MELKHTTKLGIGCYFTVEKFNKDGIIETYGPFHNKILNCGLDRFHITNGPHSQYNSSPLFKHCNIGTGTTTPAATQTGLDTYFTDIEYTNKTTDEVTSSPLKQNIVLEFQFNIGTFSGQNIGEFGLSANSDSDYFNRQLTRVTLSVVDENIGTGDGSATNFTGSLTNGSCDTGTLVITAYDTGDNLMTLTDDGAGGFTGDGSGTIIYDSGAFDVTFSSAVKNGNNVLADYDWQEPTTITVAADEGLRIYAQMLCYAESELTVEVDKGPFTFTNLTTESTTNISYTQTLTAFEVWHGDALNTNYKLYNGNMLIEGVDADSDDGGTLTTAAAGGPNYELEYTWNPGTITGDITNLEIRWTGNMIRYDIVLGTTITGIQDTEELKFTAKVEWGEV